MMPSFAARVVAAFACWFALAGLDAAAQEMRASPPAQTARGEILWDSFGIPHIYGPDIPTVLRGFGYAQMENHAETLLGNIAQARARAAEYFGPGPDNAYVDSDIKVRVPSHVIMCRFVAGHYSEQGT